MDRLPLGRAHVEKTHPRQPGCTASKKKYRSYSQALKSAYVTPAESAAERARAYRPSRWSLATPILSYQAPCMAAARPRRPCRKPARRRARARGRTTRPRGPPGARWPHGVEVALLEEASVAPLHDVELPSRAWRSSVEIWPESTANPRNTSCIVTNHEQTRYQIWCRQALKKRFLSQLCSAASRTPW